MRIFRTLLIYLKELRFLILGARQERDGDNGNTGESNRDVEEFKQKFEELIESDEYDQDKIETVISDLTKVEIGNGGEKEYEEVRSLNYRLFELGKQGKAVSFEQELNDPQIGKDIDRLEEILRGKAKNTFTLPKLKKHSGAEIDSFFKNIGVVKIYEKRERQKQEEEQQKIRKVAAELNRLKNLIDQDELQEARHILSRIEVDIRALWESEDKIEFEESFSSLENILIYKEVKKRKEEIERRRLVEEAQKEEERKRKVQKDLIRRGKEEAERKKKEENQRKLQKLLVKKPDWKDYRKVLIDNGITELYHFTDKSNLSSIRHNKGLFSWDYCDRNRIFISVSGGDTLSRNLDVEQGLQDYVRLSFIKSHPMMHVAKRDGRIYDPVVLRISTEVVFFDKTRFSNMNAADRRNQNCSSLKFLKDLRFDLFKQSYFNLDSMEKKYFQAEVLVKTWIPIKYITNIDQFI